jgi:hypothetical protein
MKRRLFLLNFLVGPVGVASTAPNKVGNRVILKISVKSDGRIFADDHECSKAELVRRLDGMKENGGIVWFHHARRGEADPAAKAIFQLVVERRLTFGMYEDERFTRRTGTW